MIINVIADQDPILCSTLFGSTSCRGQWTHYRSAGISQAPPMAKASTVEGMEECTSSPWPQGAENLVEKMVEAHETLTTTILGLNNRLWEQQKNVHSQLTISGLVFQIPSRELLFLKVNLFIYFWLLWVFVAACGLSPVGASGGYSSLWCMGFSLRWLPLLRSVGFSSCGTRAQ